jgi:hypothetical protein
MEADRIGAPKKDAAPRNGVPKVLKCPNIVHIGKKIDIV